MTTDYPAPAHHLPLREVFPDVWLASSAISMSIPLGLQITFSRNMVAVRGPDGWVLLNPVRLSAAAEADLLARAPIAHAVRLGGNHGRDDAYYVEKHGAAFWAVPGPQTYPLPEGTHAVAEDGPFPIPGARPIVFKCGTKSEHAVFLPQHRLLVTCDSVQHYERDSLLSPLARVVMYFMGFFTPCVIGPIWLKIVTPPGGTVRPDFERILALDFDNLIGGHGTPKLGGAKAALARNVEKLPR